MPNWCYNKVVIDGPTIALKAIADKGSANDPNKTNSFLQSLIPMPKEYESLEGYNSGGYEWCINNWGTKWAESSIEMSGENFGDTGQITYQFDSAWNPPLEGYDKISQMFPELTFIHFWDEPGMAFCGIRVTKDGEEIMMEEIFDSNYPLMSFEDENGEDQYYEEMESIRDRLFSWANDAIKSLK
jgi:hypothetical protein